MFFRRAVTHHVKSPRKHVLCLEIASPPSISTERRLQHHSSLPKIVGEEGTEAGYRFCLLVARSGCSSTADSVVRKPIFFCVGSRFRHVELGTNSTCALIFPCRLPTRRGKRWPPPEQRRLRQCILLETEEQGHSF